MKNLKMTMITLSGIAAVSAQEVKSSDVPSDLRTTFEQAYPNATDVEWELESDNYKVEFEINREDHEIWYTANGNKAKAKREISEEDLPPAIVSAISGKYEGYKIDSIEITEENGLATYEIELEKGWNDEKQVVFDGEGKILNEMED